MVKYVIKRILLSILILFGVSLLLYFLVRMMPVSYLEMKLANLMGSSGGQISYEERLNEMKAYYGLDGTIIQGYWNWLVKFVQGDMGVSFKYERPVEDVIFENMGVSFGISFVSLILQLIIAIPLGIKCACNQYGKLDYFATVLTMIGISFPAFFFGSLVIKFFAVELGWFEVGGLHSNLSNNATGFERFTDMLWHLVLPITYYRNCYHPFISIFYTLPNTPKLHCWKCNKIYYHQYPGCRRTVKQLIPL